MKRFWLVALALSYCALCACTRAQDGQSAEIPWDDAKAREIAVTVASSWPSPGGPLRRVPYAILPFDQGGSERRLVLVAVASPDDTCHACAPVTGGVMFAHNRGRWEVAYHQPEITTLGANGQPPRARAQQLGSWPAVAFEMDGMSQGYEGTTLTLVGEVGGKLKELLSLQTAGSNEAAALPKKQTFRWQATLEYLPAPDNGYPDIQVTSTGTKENASAKAVRPYSTTVTYRFRDGAYRPS